MAETTRRILMHVFAVSLAKQLNFAGRGQKTGIGGMKVTVAITGKSYAVFVMSCQCTVYCTGMGIGS